MFTSMRRSNSSAGTSQVGRVAVDQGCVVDQQVGRTRCGEEPPGPGFHSVLARDVHGFEVMRCAQGRAEHLDRPGVPTAAHDRVPEPGETLGQGPPEAPRRPRDHDPLV